MATETVVLSPSAAPTGSAVEAGPEECARDEFGWTPRLYAVGGNRGPQVVRLALDTGADAPAVDARRRRAIEYARESEHLRSTDPSSRSNGAKLD